MKSYSVIVVLALAFVSGTVTVSVELVVGFCAYWIAGGPTSVWACVHVLLLLSVIADVVEPG